MSMPTTLAGFAAAILRRQLGGGRALDALLGREERLETKFHEAKRRYKTTKTTELSLGARMYYELGRQAYHGGRNECFYHGPTPVGPYYDYDMPSAYPMPLSVVRPLDYPHARQELDPNAYRIDDAGAAWITFSFPENTRFPCLPVRGPSGALFFPLEGHAEDRVVVGAPEIVLARQLGATIKIIQGTIIPWASDERIFEGFTRLVQEKRRQHPRATERGKHELWKEIGNSTYGMAAQGLREKRTFDPATLKTVLIQPSALTEPFIAAYVTSFNRAVLGEILAGVPADGLVISATTDGLLTDVPIERLRLDGPLCSAFADIREHVFGKREVLVLKHSVQQVVSISTRATYTARAREGYDPVLAKGGIKFDADPKHHNRRALNLYLRQQPGMEIEHEQLISAREQLTREADLYAIKRTRRLNLRYDFKRRPVDPRLEALSPRISRIAWDTSPWRTVTEAELARARVDGWSRKRERLILDLEAFRDWEAYHEASVAMAEACRAAGIKAQPIGDDNAQGILKRWFLRAGRQGLHGVRFERGGAMAVSRALSDAGFATTKDDVTYAARSKAPLVLHCVAFVPETLALLRVILDLYPDFDWRAAFRANDYPSIETALTMR